jgi:hypothetical protein
MIEQEPACLKLYAGLMYTVAFRLWRASVRAGGKPFEFPINRTAYELCVTNNVIRESVVSLKRAGLIEPATPAGVKPTLWRWKGE